MGKSGYLPDVSSQFGFWREYAVNSLREKSYESAQAGLYNLNQCLTDEYLVKISTKEYEELVADKTVFQCGFCTMQQKIIINEGQEDEKVKLVTSPTEIHYTKIQIHETNCSAVEQLLLGFTTPTEFQNKSNVKTLSMDSLINGFKKKYEHRTTKKYWVCPECQNDNFQKDGQWDTVKSIREEPFTLGVVPEPPKKPHHLANSLGYPEKFTRWFYNFLEEIQAKMVLYRIEFVSQNGHEMTDTGYKDPGDKS